MKTILLFTIMLVGVTFFSTIVFADPLVQVTTLVNPTPVAPGTDGYVQLTFTNTGTSVASNIQLNGVSADPSIRVTSSGVTNIGALVNGQSTSELVKFSVSNSASSGLYTIVFSINYCSSASSCTQVNPTAVVTVQSPSALQITSVTPNTLSAGQSTTLNFNLVNEGNDQINNIVLTWQTPNNELLPLGLSNRQYISSLGGGVSLDIPVNVSVGASVSPGVYPLTIQLSYFDKSGTKQNINSTVGINVGGGTDFDTTVQQYSGGTVSLSIANIGVNPATSVSVSVPEQSNYAASGATSVFLGTLNAGDFSVANFQISPRGTFRNSTSPSRNSTSASSNLLTVQISYSDTTGSRHIVEKQIPLDISSTLVSGSLQRNRGSGLLNGMELPIIVIVIIVAAALVWFFKFRKKKK